MAFRKDSGRQYVLSTDFVVVTNEDLEPAEALAAIDLPPGAVVVGGEVVVDVAFNGGGAETLAIGDADNAARYASTAALGSPGRTALILTGFEYLEPAEILLARTASGIGDEGSLRIRFEYVVRNRSNENER